MTLDLPSFLVGNATAAALWAVALWLGNRIGRRIAERAFQQYAPPPQGRGFVDGPGMPRPERKTAPQPEPAPPTPTPKTHLNLGMPCFVCGGTGAKKGAPCNRCKGKGRT